MTTILTSLAIAAAIGQETCTCAAMPSFTLKANDGLTYTQKSLTKKDTVVVFLAYNCPHNPKAVKDLNRFKAILGDKVAMVAFVNANESQSKEYAKSLGLNMPLIANPGAKIMRAFGVNHSLDMALICAKDQKVGQTWSGYSRDIFGQVLKALPQHGGPEIKADLSAFPEARQSGCGF